MAWCKGPNNWTKLFTVISVRAVKSFAPIIVILQLGTNDLSHLDPLVVASAIEVLVGILYKEHDVQQICVCQTLNCKNDAALNARVITGNSMICGDIWHKYHEWYFEIVWNITSGIYAKYHVLVLILLNQWLKLTMLWATKPWLTLVDVTGFSAQSPVRSNFYFVNRDFDRLLKIQIELKSHSVSCFCMLYVSTF